MSDIKNSLIANKFVKLIEENHQEIVERYINDLLRNEKTTAYRGLDHQMIYEIGDKIYRELSQWLSFKQSEREINNFYEKLGKMRLQQGIPASQVFYALVLLKRHMWLFMEQRLENDITEYKQATALINRVLLFFDRSVYYMLIGHEKETSRKW